MKFGPLSLVVEGPVVIITDDNVKKLYGKQMKEWSPDALVLSVPPGEQSKSRAVKQELEDAMLDAGLGRDTTLVAIGGGVVGDLAGFVAATYNRGIRFIQVPTTLLAMVDASIGGKTGVNTKHGKNLIGAFWQPAEVHIDPKFLSSLPDEEYINGLAEVVKIAVILDKDLFSYLEEHAQDILKKKQRYVDHIIKESVRLKQDVVSKDEREVGLRQILNFGHTFGHAYEQAQDYRIKHGLCVSYGIVIETDLSVRLDQLSVDAKDRIITLLKNLGLPHERPKMSTDRIVQLMKWDKKSVKGEARFVLLEDIGSAVYGQKVSKKILRDI